MKTISDQPTSGAQESCQCFTCQWRYAFVSARKKLQNKCWQEASIAYSHAYEIVDHMLTTHGDDPATVKRYLRTAIELAYSMRMSHHECDMKALVAIVTFRLRAISLSIPIEPLIFPLKDISSSSKAEVTRRMKVLFALDEARRQQLH